MFTENTSLVKKKTITFICCLEIFVSLYNEHTVRINIFDPEKYLEIVKQYIIKYNDKCCSFIKTTDSARTRFKSLDLGDIFVYLVFNEHECNQFLDEIQFMRNGTLELVSETKNSYTFELFI